MAETEDNLSLLLIARLCMHFPRKTQINSLSHDLFDSLQFNVFNPGLGSVQLQQTLLSWSGWIQLNEFLKAILSKDIAHFGIIVQRYTDQGASFISRDEYIHKTVANDMNE